MVRKGKKESKYVRCAGCNGAVLFVFECSDKQNRCARCKMEFDDMKKRNDLATAKQREDLRGMRDASKAKG